MIGLRMLMPALLIRMCRRSPNFRDEIRAHPRHLLFIADIRREDLRDPAALVNLFRDGAQLRFITRDERHRGPRGRERERHRLAEALARAGDQRGLSVK